MPRLEAVARAQELAALVLAPLVLGGPMHLVRPFGPKLSVLVGERNEIGDTDLRSRIDVARVRRARLLAPVDVLPDLTAAEWTLLCALNDLLQVTNHGLAGPFTRRRHERLLGSVRELCEATAAPRDVGDALARHATFARVLELVRTDTTVSWWMGTARFRGQPPPERLLRWRQLRRVQVQTERVTLHEMCTGLNAVQQSEFDEVLCLWLTRSPLTDLAGAARRRPAFAWSRSTLALISTAPGRAIAWRALSRQPADLVGAVLTQAARDIPAGFSSPKTLAEDFAQEVAAGFAARRGGFG
jgi:hypothetical protein